MTSRFVVAILGGVGAGKTDLAVNLPKHFTRAQNTKIDILALKSFEVLENSAKIDYKVYIDRPFDELLEKYVNSLPARKLIDKPVLAKNLSEFRRFHLKSVLPMRYSADFYVTNVEDRDRIRRLALEILKAQRDRETGEEAESEDVQVYLDRSVQKAHPSKIGGY